MLFLDWPINFFGRLTSLMDGPLEQEEEGDGAVSGVGAGEDEDAVVIVFSCFLWRFGVCADLGIPPRAGASVPSPPAEHGQDGGGRSPACALPFSVSHRFF